MEFFEKTDEFLGNGKIQITKYKSKNSGMRVYFVDIDTHAINAYFSHAVDVPYCAKIEGLVCKLDHSGGYLPTELGSDVLRPTWQHHGTENSLADRDQSSYVCSALGEVAFIGEFSCSLYVLRGIERLFYPKDSDSDWNENYDDADHYFGVNFDNYEQPECPDSSPPVLPPSQDEEGNKPVTEGGDGEPGPGLEKSVEPKRREPVSDKGSDSEYETDPEDFQWHYREKKIQREECYDLSEDNETTMAWEETLEAMFPGVAVFKNQLIRDDGPELTDKEHYCLYKYYRPDNLVVIITGTVANRGRVFKILRDHEIDHKRTYRNLAPFKTPWTETLPLYRKGVTSSIYFHPLSPVHDASSTMCFGWRGCASLDIELSYALKVLTAHAAVGPIWTEIVLTKRGARRISWCQLEYKDTVNLITVHGIPHPGNCVRIKKTINKMMTQLGDPDDDLLKLDEVREMVDRLGWGFVHDVESDPYLTLSSAISKGELYGQGDPTQIQKRIHQRQVFDELKEKPLEYWKTLARNYFQSEDTFVTQVIARPENTEETPCDMTGTENVVSEGIEEPSVSPAPCRPASCPPERVKEKELFIETRHRSLTDLHATEDINSNINSSVDSNYESEDEKSESSYELSNDEETNEDEIIPQKKHIERYFEKGKYPFGDQTIQAAAFKKSIESSTKLLAQVNKSGLRHETFTSYRSDRPEQHPSFPVDQMPFCTYLDDMETSFVYVTFIIDTTVLNQEERKLVGPITSALGAILSPLPENFQETNRINYPDEFFPPKHILHSQVSLGINGEVVQCIFAQIMTLPENYEWVLGMFHHVLYKTLFSGEFLGFMAYEALYGMKSHILTEMGYLTNHETMDATEANLHAIAKHFYKEESNMRLCVGQRRHDLLYEYYSALQENPEIVDRTNATLRRLIQHGKINVHIATDIEQLLKLFPNPVKTWQDIFPQRRQDFDVFSDSQPKLERDMFGKHCGEGTCIILELDREPCFTMAIPLDPNNRDSSKIALAVDLYSMAQRWVWAKMKVDNPPSPAIRIEYTNGSMLVLTLESFDVIGALKSMKSIINPDWDWMEPLLIATKLYVLNDPGSLGGNSPHDSISLSILSHINNQPQEYRRNNLLESLSMTVDEMKRITTEYMLKLFDPDKCFYSLMCNYMDERELKTRLKEFGFKLKKADLNELCDTL